MTAGPQKTFELPIAFQETVVGLKDKYKIPGLSVSVIRKEEGQWTQSVTTWGIKDKTGSAWEPDVSLYACVRHAALSHLQSRHAIASCSKFFAAASVGLLIERGTLLKNGQKLKWNTKIKDVLPDWKLLDRSTEENADIEDVLCESKYQAFHLSP